MFICKNKKLSQTLVFCTSFRNLKKNLVIRDSSVKSKIFSTNILHFEDWGKNNCLSSSRTVMLKIFRFFQLLLVDFEFQKKNIFEYF